MLYKQKRNLKIRLALYFIVAYGIIVDLDNYLYTLVVLIGLLFISYSHISEIIDQEQINSDVLQSKISDSKKIIKQKEIFFKSIINAINEPVLIINTRGQVDAYNNAFKKEILKKNHSFREPFLNVIIKEAYKSSKFISRKYLDQNKEYKVNIYPLDTTTSYQSILIFHDITLQKQQDYYQNQFFNDVAHEFKTPIAAISGLVDIIENNELDRSEINEFIKLIQLSNKRLENSVSRLIKINKFQTNLVSNYQIFALDKLINDSLNFYQNFYHKNDNKVELNISNITIKQDYQVIKTIIDNLIENAFKYTNNGTIKVELIKDRQNVIIKVINNNKISKPDLVFLRFYRENYTQEGLGLGLAIAKELANRFDYILSLHQDHQNNIFTLKVEDLNYDKSSK